VTDPALDPSRGPRPRSAHAGVAGPVSPRQTNALAVISLVAGLTGFSVLPLVGSIIAVATGHLARSRIRDSGEDGATLAKAGLWLGYVAIALAALAVTAMLVFIVVRSSTA
jgi:hypothetical protein